MTTTPKLDLDSNPAADGVAVLSTHTLEVDREDTKSLEELIFSVSSAALAEAGLDHERLDAVVLSGYDQTDGRVISCMVTGGPAGGVDRDVTMIASSGDHALIYGYLRLLSGQGGNVIVVGWGKPSESIAPEHAELVSAEPYVLRQVGMNHTIAAALQASRLGIRPTAPTTCAWPLSRDDLPSLGDAVYAVVLARAGTFEAGRELAWVRGAGWATGGYELGARDVTDLAQLDIALRQIQQRGGPGPSSWTHVEIAAPSEPAASAVRKHLNLEDRAVVNESGRLSERLTTPHVAGLARMVAAARAASRASDRVTAGVGMQGFAGQGVAVMTFSSREATA